MRVALKELSIIVLGVKPTFNRFSKSVVGVKPTRQTVERQILPVNRVVSVFSIFLKLAGVPWELMTYDQLLLLVVTDELGMNPTNPS